MNEREYLRGLAQRYLEIAHLPVMAQREALWYRHNALQAERPVVVVELETFEGDLLPKPQCESEFGRRVETFLRRAIVNHELIDDDKVVSPVFPVPLEIQLLPFGVAKQRVFAEDEQGRKIGFRDIHIIEDLEEDLDKLQPYAFHFDAAATERYKQYAQDTLGDLMPVCETNRSLDWFCGLSQHIIELMGMEALMYAMIDTPEAVVRLYDFVADQILRVLDWQESEGLLRPNNGNHYAGSGSYGFSRELAPGTPARCSELWGNLNSQETVSISPQMYHDFVFPAYRRVAEKFGLTYYGCCEPVHTIWEDVRTLPHLRKVSVSPWCDQHLIGEALRGGRVIYSRKPSPNFIGVGTELDEEAYARHIDETLTCAQGCELEIIHRDIYTLSGRPDKPGRAVQIIRREIDRLWKG